MLLNYIKSIKLYFKTISDRVIYLGQKLGTRLILDNDVVVILSLHLPFLLQSFPLICGEYIPRPPPVDA